MKKPSSTRTAFVLIVLGMVAMLLVSCGSDDGSQATAPEPAPEEAAPEPESEPAPEPEPAPAEQPEAAESEEIVVTFDGETCTLEGPESVPEGSNDTLYVNSSDARAVIVWIPLKKGFTMEDVFETDPPGPQEFDPENVEPEEWADPVAIEFAPWSEGAVSVGEKRAFTQSFPAATYNLACIPTDENAAPLTEDGIAVGYGPDRGLMVE